MLPRLSPLRSAERPRRTYLNLLWDVNLLRVKILHIGLRLLKCFPFKECREYKQNFLNPQVISSYNFPFYKRSSPSPKGQRSLQSCLNSPQETSQERLEFCCPKIDQSPFLLTCRWAEKLLVFHMIMWEIIISH